MLSFRELTEELFLKPYEEKPPEEKEENRLKQIGAFITIPFVLAVSPIIGWLIGSWLDEQLGTDPYLMYSLIFLGFLAGFRELFRIIKDFGNGR